MGCVIMRGFLEFLVRGTVIMYGFPVTTPELGMRVCDHAQPVLGMRMCDHAQLVNA